MTEKLNVEQAINEGNELFLENKFVEAKEKYELALTLDPDEKQKEYITIQINGCGLPAVVNNEVEKKIELSPEKKKWFENLGFKKLDIGKEIMMTVAKKLLPKLKPIIKKQKPQLIAFMRGEMDIKGKPCEGEPKKRIIIIELAEDPGGDRSKDDVIAQFKISDLVRVQVAKDKESGADLSHEAQYSIMNLLDMVMSANMENIMEEMEQMEKKEAE